MYCYNVSVLNIGLFQFSSQISVTLVSVLFTPPLVNPIYQHRAVDNFYSLGGHNRSECQCGLNFIGMPCTYKPTCIHNLI